MRGRAVVVGIVIVSACGSCGASSTASTASSSSGASAPGGSSGASSSGSSSGHDEPDATCVHAACDPPGGAANPALPPMGLRVRVKAAFSEAGITGAALVFVKAMKRYGLILADNGSNWFISGATHQGWAAAMDQFNAQLGKSKGQDFEIVKTGNPIVVVPP